MSSTGTTVKVPAPPGMVPTRDSRATSKQLDLSPHYTGLLTEVFYPQFGVFDLDNELSEFPGETGVHGGVTFDVRGVIALTIREPTGLWREIWNLLPDRCLGIRVEDRFTRLHLLHATAFAVAEGIPVEALILHYGDRTQAELDLVYGQHVRNWWRKPGEPSEVPHGKVVWQGNNPIAHAAGATLRLYLSILENPYPDRKVTRLDFVSKGSQAVPFVVALTID
ncbi:MAG: hypothetical protein KJ072_17580 [Verrucomicrobia bacterium]|nr:hypothetical protein [Verrucomicrobiota bacterium]